MTRPKFLPDPGDPAYEQARQLAAGELRRMGAQDIRNGFNQMADDLLAGELMVIQTWVVLGLLAQQIKSTEERKP